MFLNRTEEDTTHRESLCDRLWEKTKHLRYEALETNLIQGIATGNLDPKVYSKKSCYLLHRCALKNLFMHELFSNSQI